MLNAMPTEADAAVLAMAVGDHERSDRPADELAIGQVYPVLSAPGRAWFMRASADTVLRGALNAWWAAARPEDRPARRTRAQAIYHGAGGRIRAGIVQAQNQQRERA